MNPYEASSQGDISPETCLHGLGLESSLRYVDVSGSMSGDKSTAADWNMFGYDLSDLFGEEIEGYPGNIDLDLPQPPEELSHLDPCLQALHASAIVRGFGIDSIQAQDMYLTQNGYTSLEKWLDGAYRPPAPCNYCERHRLQCLTIRTTSANPNPVMSCSTCVALFRECSLSRGEKRQPSAFETLSPVMGHLHGVTEHPEDEDTTSRQDSGINRATNTAGQAESKQFVRKGARVLRAWFHENQEYPYPTEEQKLYFSQETGFSRKRISTWFANARRRQKQIFQHPTTPQAIRPGSPAPEKLELMTPMERWQASPPEHEPVPESVIQNAIAIGPISSDISDPSLTSSASMDFRNSEEVLSQFASSASSHISAISDVSGSSQSSTSAWSYWSGAPRSRPFRRAPSFKRRPRRPQSSKGEGSRYQCTFCVQSFKRKHDWYRHEKSIHLPLESWICTPDIDELQLPDILANECRFCNVISPADTHWGEHEFHICAQRPIAERSFSRKDHLFQHLRKFHGCTKVPAIESWRKETNVHSRCGFCSCWLSTWHERADHLADHFKAGLRMHQWIGDWGLDPSAMSILRGAILPSERLLLDTSTDYQLPDK